MTFSVIHLYGAMERRNDESGMDALVAELADADAEHGDVAVSHESGWTLTVLPGGWVQWENVEDGTEPRHLRDLQLDEVLELMRLTARGELDLIDGRPWHPGYGR